MLLNVKVVNSQKLKGKLYPTLNSTKTPDNNT